MVGVGTVEWLEDGIIHPNPILVGKLECISGTSLSRVFMTYAVNATGSETLECVVFGTGIKQDESSTA